MKLLIIHLCIFSIVNCIYAQPDIEWDKTYGGSSHEELRKILQTDDGNYVIGGWSSSGITGEKSDFSRGDRDFWILKINSSNQNIIWQKTIGGSGWDALYDMKLTPDGGFIIGGSSTSGISGEKNEVNKGGFDYWVVKLDSLGNIEWQKTIGGSGHDRLYSISNTNNNGYIIGGWSDSNISGDKLENSLGGVDYWILKLDNSGNIEWQNTIGGSGDESAYPDLLIDRGDTVGAVPIIQTIDGGYLLGGPSNSNISGDKSENSKGEFDIWLLKLNNNGVIQWQKTIGGSLSDRVHSIYQTYDGGFILGSSSKSNISGDKTENSFGNWDSWLIKINNSGTILWQKTIGGSDWDVTKDIVEKNNNTRDIVFGGLTKSQPSGNKTSPKYGSNDYWLVKVDSNGSNILWQKSAGASSWDNLRSFQITNDNGFILGGDSQSGANNDKSEPSRGTRDYWVVKLSADSFNGDVWPGDANYDGIANVYDILPIGVGFNASGPVRINATTNWIGQQATDWGLALLSGVNLKHADCDGNGIVGTPDVQAIGLNYGLTHSKSSPSSFKALNPDLYFSFPNDSFQEGDLVQGTIELGTMSNPINDIYGIAFSIPYNSNLIDSNSFQIDFGGSWIANTDSSISMAKDLYTASKVDLGIVRTTHTNKTGFGKLADISFIIQDNIDGKNMLTTALGLDFNNVVAIDANEVSKEITSGKDTLFISYEPNRINNLSKELNAFNIFPNPTSGSVYITQKSALKIQQLVVTDILGKEIYRKESISDNKMLIDLNSYQNGLYIVSIYSDDNTIQHTKVLLSK